MGIDYNKRDSGSSEPVAADAPVSLKKVALTKAAPSISLTKAVAASGLLRVNLNWKAQAPKVGFLKRLAGNSSIDLDLGCLYEFEDGSMGVVQAIGGGFKDRASPADDPVCWLDGDDRSGSSADGENLFVNLKHLAKIRRVLVFALIYEGVPNWAAADAVVTLYPTAGPEVEVKLDASGAKSRMCGIAMLTREGDDLSARREVRYFKGHDDLDAAYNWGLRWGPGTK